MQFLKKFLFIVKLMFWFLNMLYSNAHILHDFQKLDKGSFTYDVQHLGGRWFCDTFKQEEFFCMKIMWQGGRGSLKIPFSDGRHKWMTSNLMNLKMNVKYLLMFQGRIQEFFEGGFWNLKIAKCILFCSKLAFHNLFFGCQSIFPGGGFAHFDEKL